MDAPRNRRELRRTGVRVPPCPKDDTEIRYIIDGRNRRIGRELWESSTQTLLDDGRYLIYRDSLNPAGEVDALGALRITYVYVTKPNVPDYFINHEPGKAGTYRILSDHLGSPRVVIRLSDGVVAERLDYTSFGQLTRTTYLSDIEYTPIPFGFAGGLHDEYTGLIRFGARDYDPEAGRWTAKDPILFNGGATNLFEYVAGEPVNRKDSTGYFIDPRAYARSRAKQLRGAGYFPDYTHEDAWLHCYVSCSVTMTVGSWYARFAGHYWEATRAGNPPLDREMDEHNNACGRRLGRGAISEENCVDMCLGELKYGDLILYKGYGNMIHRVIIKVLYQFR